MDSSPEPPPVDPSAVPEAIRAKPRRKTSPLTWILLILTTPILACLCLSLLWSLITSSIPGLSGPLGNPISTVYAVTYRVEGTGQAKHIRYTYGQGEAEQLEQVNLPWEARGVRVKNEQFATLVAEAQGPNTLTCIVEVNGREYERNTLSGDDVTVTCTARLRE